MPQRDSIFISYARDDDRNSNGWISLFRDVLQSELDIHTGEHVNIFFDRDAIEIGEDWNEKILRNLRERTSHCIAFISMTYLKRDVCRAELDQIMRVEESLGATGMVLPIYFIGSTRRMEEIDDELIRRVCTRTYYDWREFRFTPPSETEIRRMVSDIVEVIVRLDQSGSHDVLDAPADARPPLPASVPADVARRMSAVRGAVDPNRVVSAENDAVYLRRESCYDESYARAVDAALAGRDGDVLALDLDCRGPEQALHHLDVLGPRVRHLFARVGSEEALARCGETDERVTYFVLPSSPDAAERLAELWEDNGYPAVDLIYVDSLYRRFGDLLGSLVTLRRRLLSDGGGIVLKCFDDGAKICYPDDEVLEDVIERTSGLGTVSDRYNGRKMYPALTLAGYEGVSCLYQINDTIGLTVDERLELFEESFLYRLEYFRKAAGDACEQDAAYQHMRRALERLRTLFCRGDFYYAETNMFLSARGRH